MSIWISVLGFIVAPIATLCAVWMTSHFAWKRSVSEKLWDRKAAAYGTILEALHEMEAWFTSNMNDEMLKRERSDAIIQERGASYRSARKVLRGVVGREVWLLDPAVKARTVTMNATLEDRYNSWFEDLDAGGFAVSEAIDDITTLATNELNRGWTH